MFVKVGKNSGLYSMLCVGYWLEFWAAVNDFFVLHASITKCWAKQFSIVF